MPEKYSKRIEEAVRACRRKDTEADHTLIAFWGYGGPTRAAGLSHEVIVELCKDLDILAYDACMVGQIETVQLYALGGFEGYMVANLGYIGWRGFPYHFILQRLLAECPDLEGLAIIMVEEFSNYLNQLPYMSEVQTSQAVINVQEVGGVVESFEALVGLLTEGMKDYRPQIRNARSLASQAWGITCILTCKFLLKKYVTESRWTKSRLPVMT